MPEDFAVSIDAVEVRVVALAKRNARMGAVDNPFACWMRDQIIRFVPRRVILKSLVALGRPPR